MLFATALAWGVVSSAGATSASYTNVVFSDGFESGSFNNWDAAPPGNGSATIVAAAAHTGTNGLRMTNAAGQFNLAIKTLPGPLTDSSVSFYIRPNTTSVQLVAQARDAASSSSTMWDLYYDGGQHGFWFYPHQGTSGSEIFTGANSAPANVWTQVEVQYTATATGGAQLLLNGQTQTAWGVSGDFTRSANFQKLQLWDDATGSVDYDDVVVATPGTGATAPTAPTGVGGTAGDGSAALSWTAPASDGGSPITGYRVTPYIGGAAQTPILTGSAANTYTATGLTNGTAYTFTVAAINSVGTGPDSAASAAITPSGAATAPGAPTGVGGTAGDGSVALSWTAPASDGGSAITGYRVTPYTGGTAQTPTLTDSAATTFSVTGLTNGTAYTFKVAAINGIGTGAESAASAAITPSSGTTVPGAPTGVGGSAGSASVALSWTSPASDGGSTITGYRVTPYIGATAQTPVLTGSAATAFTVTGLTNGTAYTFTVAAINAVGTGADSAASAAITPAAATAPGAPTGVGGTAGNASVALSWTAPASDGGSTITGYRVTPYIGATAQSAIQTGSASTSYNVTGLTNGTAYTFKVAAINSVGTGADSAPSAAVTPAALNPIQIENALPGDPEWGDFGSPPTPNDLSGYGSKISVDHGQSLDLFVTTTAANVSINVYRMGYYGGAGARLMASLGTFPGVSQVQATPNPANGMIEEHWTKTTTLQTQASWVSGVYFARLMSSAGYGAIIMFVVRDDGGHEPLLFQASTNTYQAYNVYGGTSLYNNNTNGSIWSAPHATKVSYDRPFLNGDGAGQFLPYEYPFVRWAEKNGYNMAYTTDVDTSENTNPLTNYKGFLVVGHDEYWSKPQRDNVENAIASGVNVGFFSGNESYWQVRFEPSSTGVPDRVLVGYKDFANCACAPGPDPKWNVNNSVLTGLWRDPQVGRPEEQMMGVMFGGEVFSTNWVVQNASNWVYAGTGWTNGQAIPGIVGYEYDHFFGDSNTPPGVTVLSNSPLVNTENGQADTQNGAIYTAPSGARVFAASSIQFSWGLDNWGGNTFANAGIQQMTSNILNNFSTSSGTPGPTVPTAPTGVGGTPGDGTVALSWTAPASDGGSPISSYRITPYIGATAQTAIVTGTNATTRSITGLTNGTAYTFKVAAINGIGTGADSAASSAITPAAAATAPGAPTGVGGTAGDASVALSWTAPASDGGSAITGYRVTPSIGGTAQTPILTGSAATTFTVTGLTNGTAYTFTVAAINAVGTGAGSAASAAITPSATATAPGAPTGVGGTAGDASVALSWTAPASDGGSAITGYRVTPFIGATAQTAVLTGSAATTFTVTGLTNGTAYTFRVAAINAVGTGADSAASAAITPAAAATAPGAPTGVGGTAGNGSVALSWTAPASNGGSAITGYRVTPSIGATAQTPVLTGSAATTFTVTGLTNGTAYTFRVAAINAVGTGADSAASAAVTPQVQSVRLVQALTSPRTTASTTPTGTFTSAVVTGDTLVGAFALGGTAGRTVSSVTDSQGNTWAKAVSTVADSNRTDAEIWYTTAKASSTDTVTLHLSASSKVNITLAEFSGGATFQVGTGAASTATSHSSGNTAAASAGDFVVGLYADRGLTHTLGIGDGKLQLGTNVGTTTNPESDQSYVLGVAAGAQSAVFTTSASATGSVVVAAFKPQ